MKKKYCVLGQVIYRMHNDGVIITVFSTKQQSITSQQEKQQITPQQENQ
jgi:hypothetical protein